VINGSLLFRLKDMCAFIMCVLLNACAIVYLFYQKFSTPKCFPKTNLFVSSDTYKGKAAHIWIFGSPETPYK